MLCDCNEYYISYKPLYAISAKSEKSIIGLVNHNSHSYLYSKLRFSASKARKKRPGDEVVFMCQRRISVNVIMEFWTELVNTHLQFYDYIDSRVSFYDSDPSSDPPDFCQIVFDFTIFFSFLWFVLRLRVLKKWPTNVIFYMAYLLNKFYLFFSLKRKREEQV